MSIDNRGAHITRRDVTDLAAASERLVVVADLIRSSGVKWGEVAVNLLIVVNETVVRIQTKGAACYARYLEKHPSEKPQDASKASTSHDDACSNPQTIADEREP